MLMKASSSSMLKTKSIYMYTHTHNENKRFVSTIYIQVLGFFAALWCFPTQKCTQTHLLVHNTDA